MDSLAPALREAKHKAHETNFGTKNFFHEESLAVHRAFDSWCREHDLHCETTYNTVREHCKTYPHHGQMSIFRVLFKTLPDQFNVRGNWTSEYSRVAITYDV